MPNCSPVNSCKMFSSQYPLNTKSVLLAKWKHNITEQNIVALNTVSLNSPVFG